MTHDIFYHALNQTYSDLGKFYPHFDTITIEDNVYALVVSPKLCLV